MAGWHRDRPGRTVLALAGLCPCWGRSPSYPSPGPFSEPVLALNKPVHSCQPGLLTCQALRSTCCDAILLIRAESWSRDSWLAGWQRKPCRREVLALSRRRQVVREEVGREGQPRWQHAGWGLDSQHRRETQAVWQAGPWHRRDSSVSPTNPTPPVSAQFRF